jgi:HK97 family phage major capsid protein
MFKELSLIELKDLSERDKNEYFKELSVHNERKAAEREARLETLEKSLRELKARGGRMSGAAPMSFADAISNAILEQTDNIGKLQKKDIKEFGFEVKAVGDMTFASNFSSADVSVSQVRPGIIGLPARPLHIRELLPMAPMNTRDFVYLKETGGEGAPTAVSEGSAKAQIDFDLEETTSPAQVIAGWVVISNQMLDDVASLRGFLANRLLEKLFVSEDAELLNGSGSTPHLSGINHAGNFTAYAGLATINIERLIEAIGQLAALSRNPSGIILSPSDYFALALHKGDGSGDYTLPPLVTVGQNGLIMVAGVPVMWTSEQAAGTFTIGDFINGCVLLNRQSPRIEFFVDAELAKVNKTLIRIEERVAFPIFGDDYFIKGDLNVSEGSV